MLTRQEIEILRNKLIEIYRNPICTKSIEHMTIQQVIDEAKHFNLIKERR